MANNFVGVRARLGADVETLLYTTPADTGATLNINMVNHGPDIAMVSIAISGGAAPADGDWIEVGVSLNTGQTLLRTNEPMTAAEAVYVKSDKATVDVRVSGYQEDV